MMDYQDFKDFYTENEPSITGDNCHKNIFGILDKHTKKFVKEYFIPPHIYMLCKGVEVKLTKEQYEDFDNLKIACAS